MNYSERRDEVKDYEESLGISPPNQDIQDIIDWAGEMADFEGEPAKLTFNQAKKIMRDNHLIVQDFGKGGKVETDKDNGMFKIRVSYMWTKQGGARLRPGDPSPSLTEKSEPAKVFIEIGGKKSIVHDENWDTFVKKGLIEDS